MGLMMSVTGKENRGEREQEILYSAGPFLVSAKSGHRVVP